MKPIPPYWAQHHETVTFHGGTTWDMTITGSSLVSEEDAQRNARERLARFVASGGPDGDTPRGWYYPDRQLPEELLEEIRSEDVGLVAAITRNRYGAAILNTDAVLITDVDLAVPATGQGPDTGRRARRSVEKVNARGHGLLGWLFRRSTAAEKLGSTSPTDPTAGATASSPSDVSFEERLSREVERITGLIGQFAARNPELGVRTYRTRNGFRVLITGAEAPPRSNRAAQIMEDLTSDALYMRLCRVQECYRARLTPKPWRIGMRRIHRANPRRPGSNVRHDWVRDYEVASQGYAVCELVSTSGPWPTLDEQRLIELHDRATHCTSGLPLA